jgi:hypothetical protein
MNRFGTKKVGMLESFRVWSHRLRGRGVRYVHHDEVTGRTHRANFFRARVLK